MGLIRTYPDAGVLIVAARSSSALAKAALSVLDDPNREFATSAYLELEFSPRMGTHNSDACHSEIAFAEDDAASEHTRISDEDPRIPEYLRRL